MKMITKHELIKLAKKQNPELELHKMSYVDILGIKKEIEQLTHATKDYKLSSILIKLKSHVEIAEDKICYTEVRKIEKLGSLEEIVAYIEKIERSERVPIYV